MAVEDPLPRALIWDVDGTLAETEHHGHRVAFNLAFEEAGLPWHWDETIYARLLEVTGGKERLRAWWRSVDPAVADSEEATQRILQLHQRKTAHYLAFLEQGGITLRPGVKRLIDAARAAGIRQAIATTTTPDNLWPLLGHEFAPLGRATFEVIGAGDVVAAKKPAPDIYRWVLERLGLEAAQCLAIEDSAVGAASAVAAGVPVLVTRSHYTVHQAMPPVLAVLDSLDTVTLSDLSAWRLAKTVPYSVP